MEPARYPHREIVHAGECGKQPLDDLRVWTQGLTFHPYGVRAYDRGPTIEEALERMREHPAALEFQGKMTIWGSGLEWHVRFRQAGDPDSWGSCGWHMTPEDAAYAALALIEEQEREAYEEALVVGIA